MSTPELGLFSDEKLLRMAREALQLRRYSRAGELFREYFERQYKLGKPPSASVLAAYGLVLGHMGQPKEGLDLCLKALSVNRRSADVYWGLAGLYALARSRKKTVDAIERGLSLSPGHPELMRLRDEIGFRHTPAIPFLSRDSAVNVRLGKAIHKRRRKKSS
jgi:tetratricopeptide (TPR) repeat protein